MSDYMSWQGKACRIVFFGDLDWKDYAPVEFSLSFSSHVRAAYISEPTGVLDRKGRYSYYPGGKYLVDTSEGCYQYESDTFHRTFSPIEERPLDDRERRLIQNCKDYANGFPAGLPGHQIILLVAKLAEKLGL